MTKAMEFTDDLAVMDKRQKGMPAMGNRALPQFDPPISFLVGIWLRACQAMASAPRTSNHPQ